MAGAGPGSPPATDHRLAGEHLTIGYRERTVIDDLTVGVPTGELTAVVGPNACGKSTLLRTLARVLLPTSGSVVLDGQSINSYPAKEVARRLGLLPQSPSTPEGILVEDLVSRGRYPHQRLLRQWSEGDAEAVEAAMAQAGVSDLAGRLVDELSGGQRQRVWLAMALAQQTSLLLLDEPTTYLDISHQIEVLDLCEELYREGLTVVVVLHDLNLAFRYATHLVVMHAGQIVATGAPSDIVDAALIEQVFGLACRIVPDPETGTPNVVPRRRSTVAARTAGGLR